MIQNGGGGGAGAGFVLVFSSGGVLGGTISPAAQLDPF